MKATGLPAPPGETAGPGVSQPARWWLVVILLVSAGLRIQLAGQGGQAYWPDELRYETSRRVIAAAFNGDWHSSAERLLSSSDHIFFRFIGLVPALLEHALFPADAIPPAFAAAFFGLWGVGAIGLLWLIARKETRDEPTATWCALFYAGCVTGFFFGRHYFPYDPAIGLLLLGWWQALRSRSAFQHWLTGAVVGLGYLTYNAYWNLAAVILIFHVLRPRPGPSLFARAGWGALGLVTPVVVIFTVARCLGYDLIAHSREFSQTVTHGGFGHGWRYIPDYFATAEGAYGALLLLLAAAGMIAAARKNPGPNVWLWPAMAGALIAEMIFFSDLVPRFALSGRSIKPLGLFLALSAGLAAGLFKVHRSRSRAGGLAVLAVGLAALNFRVPLSLRFPHDFRLEAEVIIAAERMRDPDVVLQMYYADFMHQAHFITAYPKHYTVLLQRLHPLQYRPYQFEGYDTPTRKAFQAHDFSMRLVRVTGATEWQSDTSLVGPDLKPYSGALELEIDLPYPRPAGHSEPLVVAGTPGKADLFSIRYLDARQIEILVDHWGWGAVRSAPFSIPADANGPQHVIICAGSLLPPASRLNDPDLKSLAQQVVVTWNGRMIMRESLPLYPTPASGVIVGQNYVGGTTANIEFTGQIRRIRQIDPRLVMRREWGVEAPDFPDNEGSGRNGPLLADFDWDVAAAQRLSSEAVVFAARSNSSDSMLTVRMHGADAVFSLWMKGERIAETPPQAMSSGRHQLELWSPLFAPAGERPPPANLTLTKWLRENFLLKLDGRSLLHLNQPVLKSASAGADGVQFPAYFVIGRPWPLEANRPAGRFPGRFVSVAPLPLAGPVLLQALWQEKIRGSRFFSDALGPIRLKLRFPTGRTGAREPLFATGSTGAADVLFVVYESDGRIRIGHDHWGWKLLMSEPLELDLAGEHTIDVSIGSLYPPDSSPLSRRIYVAVNGKPVLAGERESYAAPLSSVVVGKNLIGASTCGLAFTGELLEISYLDPTIALPPAAPLDPHQ